MAIFTLYFSICLLGLIIRGYYHMPPSCIKHQVIDKDEDLIKTTIADRIECKCHYTNFFRRKYFLGEKKQIIMNFSSIVDDGKNDKTRLELMGLVRKNGNKKQENDLAKLL